MSIKDMQEKIKPFYVLILILLLVSIFLALWRLSAIQEGREPIRIISKNTSQTALSIGSGIQGEVGSSSNTQTQTGEVVGSKSGKKYYFPWCGTVKRIKPENQVRFSSIDEAKKAGFIAGGNCKGLK